tara:strand:+ start:280 stop:453 length:174 start_codon:yes stop_codon:yes gene_type:complete
MRAKCQVSNASESSIDNMSTAQLETICVINYSLYAFAKTHTTPVVLDDSMSELATKR